MGRLLSRARPFRVVAAAGGLLLLSPAFGAAQAPPPEGPPDPGFEPPASVQRAATGPAITDGTYRPADLRPGTYETVETRARGCTARAVLRPPRPGTITLYAKARASPLPPGRRYAFISAPDEWVQAWVFTGGCRWRRIGTVEDAMRWFHPPLVGRPR